MQQELSNVKVECVRGDIADQPDMDAVVNSANAQLRSGGGVAGALHAAAGPGLEQESQRHAPIEPGDAVITEAYDLPNDYVIHCLGPVYDDDEPSDSLLASCYREALKLADEKGIGKIAFPSISTGTFGYPVEAAARVAMHTIKRTRSELDNVVLIRFVLHTESDQRIYDDIRKELSL
ncbi:Appr-1-p processing protein [Pseudidiomarina salinarum]|uniref:Appr-1-p processing protein n=1 Tax=Pseudidiomarina salinarum TaxID=435908 RepID=A0A094ITP0_9GAMM|nr:Appr-1-p processing protein [Pseudidiomarina salinarum]RUO71578.1 macro domain-containing protein [Pseudidiomarina salinarum]